MKISKRLIGLGVFLALGSIAYFTTAGAITLDTVSAFFTETIFSESAVVTASVLLIMVAALATGIHAKRHQLSRTLDKLKRTLGQLQDNNIYATS